MKKMLALIVAAVAISATGAFDAGRIYRSYDPHARMEWQNRRSPDGKVSISGRVALLRDRPLSDTPGGVALRRDRPLEPQSRRTLPDFAFAVPKPVRFTFKLQDGSTRDWIGEYDSIANGICEAKVRLAGGGEILVRDRYRECGGLLVIDRRLEVIAADAEVRGYRSRYSVAVNEQDAELADYEYFIPSLLYRDTSNLTWSVASELKRPRLSVKEVRCGMPLAMIREKASGRSLALVHFRPEISVGGVVFGGPDEAVDARLQYGSIGFDFDGRVAAEFCYPCNEGPRSYGIRDPKTKKDFQVKSIWHPLERGNRQRYSLAVVASGADSFPKAMTAIYKWAFMVQEPKIHTETDPVRMFNDTVSIFADTYKEFGTGKVVAAGVPWSVDLKGKRPYEYTFQMGFVGQQTWVGSALLRKGRQTHDAEAVRKGCKILDFWTSETIMKGKLPIVWWDARDTETAGHWRRYPSFLRCFVDGMEGVLNAYCFEKRRGKEHPAWMAAVRKTADFLVEHQLPDGAFRRAYEPGDGSVCTNNENRCFQGPSKLNTPVAVPFLVHVYEATKERKYLEAALKAADFCYDELYVKIGKFVGGTPDNPNVVDKEAAPFALSAFALAAKYDDRAKGNRRKEFLEAADYAAACCMSWVYTYDFKCPAAEEYQRYNPFANGGVIGSSLVSAVHSGADCYAASISSDFRNYLNASPTKNPFAEVSKHFLLHNPILCTDYDGRLGLKYRALGPEILSVASMGYWSRSEWLAWCGGVFVRYACESD